MIQSGLSLTIRLVATGLKRLHRSLSGISALSIYLLLSPGLSVASDPVILLKLFLVAIRFS